jgi:hypothetical protein
MGSLNDLSRVLWKAVRECEQMLESEDKTLKLRAIHALAQVSGPFVKALDGSDIEARLEAIEAAMPQLEPVSGVIEGGKAFN